MKQLKDAPCIIILFEGIMVLFAVSHNFDQFLEIYSWDDEKLNAEKLLRHYLQDKMK